MRGGRRRGGTSGATPGSSSAPSSRPTPWLAAWNDFWLAWIAVDIVGVPLLVHSGFYPSAVLYAVYAGLVLYGFFVWLRVSRTQVPDREPSEVAA